MRLHWRDFYFQGLELVSSGSRTERDSDPTKTQDRIFRSQYGVLWHVCADVWNLLDEFVENSKRRPKQLLWTLLFLKVYGNEQTHSKIVGTSPKIFRSWVWNTLDDIADLKPMIVSLSFGY